MHWIEQLKSWGGLSGAAIGAVVMLIVSLVRAKSDRIKVKSDHEIGMTREQRLMLEALWAQVQSQGEVVVQLHNELASQHDYYEHRIQELRDGYKAHIKTLNERLESKGIE